jgi:hypothetical protein
MTKQQEGFNLDDKFSKDYFPTQITQYERDQYLDSLEEGAGKNRKEIMDLLEKNGDRRENNFPEPKYHLGEKVTIDGRRGKISMRGYDYIDSPNTSVGIDDYQITFDDESVYPVWTWVKEDKIT